MSITRELRQAVTRRLYTDVVCECRRCGTSVTPGTDACPECEDGEIAQYRIP